MNLKIKTIILSALLLLTTIFVGSTVFSMNNTNKEKYTTFEEDFYILKEHNGFLAIFSSKDSASPLKLTNILLESLPEKDKTKIQNGIIKNSYFEIINMLEDYE